MSKLIERMVCRQITSFLEGNGLLPKHQSGFRARNSTETAVLKVMSDILAADDDGKVTLLGLLDMSAAFDTVDHQILLHRLEILFGLTFVTDIVADIVLTFFSWLTFVADIVLGW